MQSSKHISSDLTQLQALQQLSHVYAEVASMRMKQTRDKVLFARTFLASLHQVFEEVLTSYAAQVEELTRRHKHTKGHITFLSHNGKSVAVLLSANAGLYGPIVPETYQLFIEKVRKYQPEVTIVGKQGLSLFVSDEPQIPYTYFDLPDYGPTAHYLGPMIKHIVKYEEIHLYFGEYQSVIMQKPKILDISSYTSLKKSAQARKTHFYFEPDLERILAFFETEIFTSLFEQTISESRLAKYSSRIVAMDQANEQIKKEVKKLTLHKQIMAHKAVNRKQLNQLPSVFFRTEKAWYE